MICVFATSFLVLENLSSFFCLWRRRVGQSARLPPASGCACGLTPAPCCGRGGRWRWRSRCWWWGQSSREMTKWMKKGEQRHDERWTKKSWPFVTLGPHENVRSMCCGAYSRKVCVCVQLGGHSVYTSVALTAVAAGWVRNPVSAASVEELSTKKRLKMIVRTRCFRGVWSSWSSHCAQLPGAQTNSTAPFNLVPFLLIISPLMVLPIALVPWVPVRVQDGESHQLELGVQVNEEGWWLIC